MPTVAVASTLNPNIYSFLSVLEVFKGSYSATVSQTTKAVFTVSPVTYTVQGTGFVYTSGKLSAGTITSIQTNIGTGAGTGQFLITGLNLSVSTVTTAASQEGINPLALESLLSGQSWEINAGDSNNTATPGTAALTGTNTWKLDVGNDTATGGSGIDKMYGSTGNDSLSGGASADTLFGEAGTDTLSGGDGIDALYGGAGADSLNGNAGNDKLYGGDEDSLVNSLVGGAGSDLLSDGDGAGVLLGGDDNDRLYGDGGNDSLNGGDGADKLLGDAGDDSLTGGLGNDTFTGGGGTDTMTGNDGADVFVFTSTSQLGSTTATADMITDFTSGTDKIKLTALNLNYVGTNGFTTGTTAAEARWDATNTRLQIDSNGDNAIDWYIDLQAGATLVASDLLL